MTEPKKQERIQTDRGTKQAVTWLLAQFLATPHCDRFEYLRLITIRLRGEKKIADASDALLIERYGHDEAATTKRLVLIAYPAVVQYDYMQHLRGLIETSKKHDAHDLAKYLLAALEQRASHLRAIDDAVIRMFVATINVTDCRDLEAKSQEILRASLGQLPRNAFPQFNRDQGLPTGPAFGGGM